MGNETEKNAQQQTPNPTGTPDPSKKNPSHEGQTPNQQDPSKKNPSQGGDDSRRQREDGSDQGEKRRAS